MLGLGDYSRPARTELWESTLEALRHAIISGSLPAGTRLVETELSRSLQVSRLPVRQAITRLEQEGLVVRYPGRGAYVVEFAAEDVRDIWELRSILETYAAREAAVRIDPQAEARLHQANEEFRRSVEAGDPIACAELDIAFHRAIVSLAGSERLLHMWELLVAPLQVLLSIHNPRLSPQALRFGPRAHEHAIAALCNGSPDAAAGEMDRQLQRRGGELLVFFDRGTSERDEGAATDARE